MKKKIFLRFFALTFLSILLVFAVGIIAVNLSTKSLLHERLKAETGLACALVSEESDFDSFKIYFNNDQFRVTVFSTLGDVLYESDTKAEMENHADRKEFIDALNGKSQAIERYSNTFKCRMTYYALKTKLDSGKEIVIRLAVKNSQVSDYISFALPLLIVVLVLSTLLSIVFANVQSKAVANKITEVGKSLKSLNEGNYMPIKADSSDQELIAVYNEINDLSISTYEHILNQEREHEKLDSVLSNVSQGIIALNYKNKIVFANKSAYDLFKNTSTKESDLLCLINDKILYEKIVNGIKTGLDFEYDYEQKILSVVIKKITAEKLLSDVSVIMIITDITAEKTIQKQKSDFFANASHELKTPVTVMQGLSEILLSKDLDESSKRQIDRINKESLRLSSLISDMLKLSRLERGEKFENTLIEVDIGEITEEVLNELSAKAESKGVKISFQGGGTVKADPKKIFEIVENLISNAINYNKENGTIDISAKPENGNLIFSVKDSGIGIEKEHIPRLCERFYRVDKSRSKKTGGTGLGLAIVKHVCALYGAELKIESEVGIGTTVTVKFINAT